MKTRITLFHLAITLLSAWMISAPSFAQNPAGNGPTKIIIEKSDNGSTSTQEKVLEQNNISIDELLRQEGLLDELGNLEPNEEVEIIIRKKENTGDLSQIKVLVDPALDQQIQNEINREMENLLRADRAFLGVYYDFEIEGPGNEITSVIEGTAAEEAGLMEGDIVLEVDGEVVNEIQTLTDIISQHQAGDKVTLKVLRDEKNIKIKVTLGTKANDIESALQMHRESMPELVRIAPPPVMPQVSKARLGVQLLPGEYPEPGAPIHKVLSGTPAESMGLMAGDRITRVNGNLINNTAEAVEILGKLNPGDAVNITWMREGTELVASGIMQARPDAEVQEMNKEVIINQEAEMEKARMELENANRELTNALEELEQIQIITGGIPGELEELDADAPEIKNEIVIRMKMLPLTALEAAELSNKSGTAISSDNDITPDNFVLFPNPAREKFNIAFTLPESGVLDLKLMDLNGKIIRSEQIKDFDGSYAAEFDLTGQSAGTYVLHLSVNGKTWSRKIVTQ